jgi:hypothetical protein
MRLATTLGITAFSTVMSVAAAAAQVNCNVVADRSIRMNCHRQSIQAQQQYIDALERNNRSIDRLARGMQYFDRSVDFGTRVIQGSSGGRVPLNSAYRTGRAIGSGGATWYLRRNGF